MKTISVAQMRDMERRAVEEFEVPVADLMERAGQRVAHYVSYVADQRGWEDPFILLVAGRGNNGGDAFVAARHLKEMDYQVEVWLAGAARDVQGDALKHLSRMKSAGVKLEELPDAEDWRIEASYRCGADIVVDGVLGIGLSGPARGPVAGAIQFINRQALWGVVVSIDVPSGLNADTGVAEGDTVLADYTVTLGLPKQGLLKPVALDYVGRLEVADIGFPAACVNDAVAAPEQELISIEDVRTLLPRRKRQSHKGDYGRVLVVGGARGYAGAIVMAAKAAVRSGAGLVTALVPQSLVSVVAGATLETMVVGGAETSEGSLSAALWNDWRRQVDRFDAVLIGPGLTRSDESLSLVRHFIRECEAPLVLDADALVVLAGQEHWLQKAKAPLVITPHPGEMALLFGHTIEAVQQDRFGMALAAARTIQATVVLKGAGTIVTGSEPPVHVNMTGNPGMASGGSGDVLSGLLAGLLAQGLKAFDAARLAVFLHGDAGDVAAARRSQAGLSAGDLLEELPFTFRLISPR